MGRPIKIYAVVTHPNIIHNEILKTFWSKFGGVRNVGIGYKKKAKIEALRWALNFKIKYKSGRSTQEVRRSFDKYSKNRYRNSGLCFACLARGYARHHIISIDNGGRNVKKNIVILCQQCHALLHPWMR